MKSALIKILTVGMTIQMAAFADSVVTPPPRAWAITSEDGSCFVTMVPSKNYGTFNRFGTAEQWRTAIAEREEVSEPAAFAVAYRITAGGRFEELWRATGWRGSGYLANSGRYFIRLGGRGSDQENHTDLAVAFYDRGQLMKRYQVRELIKNPDLLEDTVSHYTWRPETQTKSNGFLYDEEGPLFHLVMIDKTTYKFNYETGEIVATGRDEGAKSSFERLLENEEIKILLDQHQKRGKALFEASSFKDDFSRHFEISAFETTVGPFGGWVPRKRAWSAELRPKRKFSHDIVVQPVIAIEDNKLVDVSITATQILEAIENGFQHPYIEGQFNNGEAIKMIFYIREDRLHLDTQKLLAHIEETKGMQPDEVDLRNWAGFTIIILDKNKINDRFRFVTSELRLHFNIQTGEIIGDELTKAPPFRYKPYLIDANGIRK